jgi:F-type H+-transporting ATPase subunit b
LSEDSRMNHKALPALATLLMAVPALAAEGHGEETPVSPFVGDVGNMIWTLLIFLIVVVSLGKLAWGPILNLLQKREDFIRNSLEQAKKDREEAEATLKTHAEKLDGARAEASAIVDEARRDAEVVKRKIEEATNKEADTMLERARREIQVATDTAVRELYDLSGKLATEVASRIIRKEIDAKEHERLIAESLEELGKVERN